MTSEVLHQYKVGENDYKKKRIDPIFKSYTDILILSSSWKVPDFNFLLSITCQQITTAAIHLTVTYVEFVINRFIISLQLRKYKNQKYWIFALVYSKNQQTHINCSSIPFSFTNLENSKITPPLKFKNLGNAEDPHKFLFSNKFLRKRFQYNTQ